MKKYFLCCFLAVFCNYTNAQEIILDRPIKVGELTVFPSVNAPNDYYYLSDKPRLAIDPNTGKPQFSFLRYVDNQRPVEGQAKDAEGGGILHCVVELGISEEQKRGAQQALSRVNPNGVLKGPVLYQGGTIALISSVNDPQSGFLKKILGLGKAPILDGHKAAISISLTKLGAKILWETFQMPTPDMSISFEMELKGYRSPKRAIIEANFDQIYQHQSFQAGFITRQGGALLAGEINTAFENLQRTGAIKVTQIGTDENMEKAIEDAYSKLTKLMFDPAEGTGAPPATAVVPGTGTTSILDRAEQILQRGRQQAYQDLRISMQEEQAMMDEDAQTPTEPPSSSGGSDGGESSALSRLASHPRPSSSSPFRNRREQNPHTDPTRPALPTSAIVTSYTMRNTRQRGTYKIDLNKFAVDNLTIRFDQNVGKVDNCTDCFRQINLDDPLYKQRQISAVLDGFNAEDFQKYINFVNVSMRKKHENGEFTDEEIKIDRAKFNQEGNFFDMMYGWKGDNNRTKWKDYEYKTVWNFFGGANSESPWIKTNISTIPLSPPVVRKLITIEIDQANVDQVGIRIVEVKVSFKILEKEQIRQVRLNTQSGELSTQVEILQLPNEIKYDYEVIWTSNDGSTKSSGKKLGSTLVVIANQL